MKKVLFSALALILALSPQLGSAQETSLTFNPLTPVGVFYAQTFDNLVFDFSLQSVDGDSLSAVVFRNEGTAKWFKEIDGIYLWADDGNEKFDGFAVDTEIAKGTYDDANSAWVFSDLDYPIHPDGEQFFVSVTARKGGTSNKTADFSMPSFFDTDEDGAYDPGDTGVFLNSGAQLPTEKLLNSSGSSYKDPNTDSLPPVTVMTNLSDGSVLDVDTTLITGKTKDQGGSFADTLDVCIDGDCLPATSLGKNFENWEFAWGPVPDGDYEIYTRTTDFNNNTAQTQPITVTIATAPVTPPPPPVVVPPVPELYPDYTTGRWVKTADSDTVYHLDSMDVRHAYPNQSVWASYFGNDFSFVEVITGSELASYDLGRNVTFKAGTLMKIPSVPKVYVVQVDGSINWLSSEAVAARDHGSDWANQVRDLTEAFFTDYIEGEPII